MQAINFYNQLAFKSIPYADNIKIFNTTLRNSEQTLGITLSSDDKVRIAMTLDNLGVNIIEVGFIVSFETEREMLKDHGRRHRLHHVQPSRICKGGGTGDVDAVLRTSVAYIHTFIATSNLHIKYRLKMIPDQVVERTVNTIEYAREHDLEVMFSCEDTTKSDLKFMKKICTTAQT